MTYLKSFFFHFLTVFFASHLLAGVEVVDPTRLPHIGADVYAAIALGLCNSLIYPILKMFRSPPSWSRLAIGSAVLSFGAYAVLTFIPLGIQISGFLGYFSVSVLVAVGSFAINYLEWRTHLPKAPKCPEEPPPVA